MEPVGKGTEVADGKKIQLSGWQDLDPWQEDPHHGNPERDAGFLFRWREMVRDGADIIDIGAESTRPGSCLLSPTEEQERLAPFLERVLRECPLPVSVDTFKGETAEMADSMGAHIIKDIWGLPYGEEPWKMA